MKGGFLKKLNFFPALSIKQGFVLHLSSSDKKAVEEQSEISQKHSRSCSIASDESICSFRSLPGSMESLTSSPGENEEEKGSKSEMVECPPGGEHLIIFYTTSLRGIRKTFEDCTAIRFLLKSFNIKFYERDVSMDLELRNELWKVMGGRAAPPRLFIKGKYIGGADEVVRLHEQGKLHKLLQGIAQVDHQPCQNCFNIAFVLCSICHGSCKVLCEDEFTRCNHCNENGLVRCHNCS